MKTTLSHIISDSLCDKPGGISDIYITETYLIITGSRLKTYQQFDDGINLQYITARYYNITHIHS